MIDQETVFIIGAGAHTTYGFPTGAELKRQLLKVSAHDLGIARQYEGQLESFKNDFLKAGTDSIDAFLEMRPEHLDAGKLCIAHCIGKCEHRETRLWDNDWIRWLMNEPMSVNSLDDFSRNKVTFVTFNYDRFLEHHLLEMLMARFGVGTQDVANAFHSTKVIHMHGSLGKLPWQASEEKLIVRFGLVSDSLQSKKIAASCITLVHESEPEPDAVALANRVLQNAKLVFFIGYGYNHANNRKLRVRFGTPDVYVFGTGYGLTDAQRDRLTIGLFKAGESPIRSLQPAPSNMQVLEFFKNCPHLLAMTPL